MVLKHGWFCVKQFATDQGTAGISHKAARREESRYFNTNTPWNSLDPRYRNRLGTAKLESFLNKLLLTKATQEYVVFCPIGHCCLISHVACHAYSEMWRRTSSQQIRSFPFFLGNLRLMQSRKLSASLRSLRASWRSISRATPTKTTVYCSSCAPRPADSVMQFKLLCRTSDHAVIDNFVSPPFLFDDGSSFVPTDSSKAIYVEDVIKRAEG